MVVALRISLVICILFILLHDTTSFRRKKKNEKENPTRKPFVVTKFLLDIWNYHNEIRFMHQVPPLELDKRLSENSEEWANYLINFGGSAKHSFNDETYLLKFTKWANDVYMENMYFDPHELDEKVPEDPARETFFHEYNEDEVSAGKGWYTQLLKRQIPMDYSCTNTMSTQNVEQFANVVWKSTKFVGCGHAFGFNPSGMKNVTVVVCQYLPQHGSSVQELCENIKKPVKAEGRDLTDFQPRNLTKMELSDATKAKHPLVRFQKQLLDFLRTMKLEKKKHWYDIFLFGL